MAKNLNLAIENYCPRYLRERPRLQKALGFLLLFVVVFTLLVLSYGPALHGKFFFIDDALNLSGVPIEGISLKNLGKVFSFEVKHVYIPFRDFTYLCDYSLAKLFSVDPAFIMRLSNIFYLSLIALLVFELFYERRKVILWAATVAILFAIHPLHTIPTVWITSRKDVLVTLFLFLAFYLKRKERLGLALVAFFLAMASKQSAYGFLLWFFFDEILSLSEVERHGFSGVRLKDYQRMLKRLTPFILAMVFYMPLSMMLSRDHPSPLIFLWDRTLGLLVHYFGQVFWPLPVTQYYPRPPSLSFLLTLLSWLVIIVIFLTPIVFYLKRKLSAWWVSVFIFSFALIEPYVIFVPGVHFVNNAYTYGIIATVLLLLADCLYEIYDHLGEQFGNLLYYAPPLLALVAISPIIYFNQFLADEFVHPVYAFERNVALFPNDRFIYTRLGEAALSEGDTEKALAAFEKALLLRMREDRRISEDAFFGMSEICISLKKIECLQKLEFLAAANNRPFYCFHLLDNLSRTSPDSETLDACWQKFPTEMQQENAKKIAACKGLQRNTLALPKFQVTSCYESR